MSSSKPLIVTMGDPAGCGPQITAKAWCLRQDKGLAPFFVHADPLAYHGLVQTIRIQDPAETQAAFDKALPVLPLSIPLKASIVSGRPSPENSSTIIESIRSATLLTKDGHAAAMVTNPISKAVLYEAGFKHPGHTEYIAQLCATDEAPQSPVMMLVGGGLRVALATIHVPLKDVPRLLDPKRLSETAKTVYDSMRREFGIAKPRLAFTGLNPHAGEEGTIGREEVEIINPVAAKLRENGLDISDARPADTVFHEALSGAYDAVIAMTHDQGLIPVKTLDLWGGVNTTLGLPIIRTSPDHGTAYEAARLGDCRPDSLIAALKLAADMARNRTEAA